MNRGVFLAGSARIGIPKEARVFENYSAQGGFLSYDELKQMSQPVTLGDKIFIGNNCTIYEGASIGDGCVIEDHSRIGFNSTIGSASRVMYAAFICDRVRIGVNCRIAGFICDAAIIGNNCTVMGQLSHKYTVSDLQWGEVDEPGPVIEDDSIIGLGSQIVGGITVGTGTFVGSGAILTKSTPPNSVVIGMNNIFDYKDWPGEELRAFYQRRLMND